MQMVSQKFTPGTRVFIAGAFLFCFFSYVIYVGTPEGAATKENDSIGFRNFAAQVKETGDFQNALKRHVPFHPRGYPFFLALLLA